MFVGNRIHSNKYDNKNESVEVFNCFCESSRLLRFSEHDPIVFGTWDNQVLILTIRAVA